MKQIAERECLQCGMLLTIPIFTELSDITSERLTCPKCDSDLLSQGDGSSLKLDIAHNHETVSEAMLKLDKAILDAFTSQCSFLHLVVGGGRIRDEVLAQLEYYRQQRYIVDFSNSEPNVGRVVISLRESSLDA